MCIINFDDKPMWPSDIFLVSHLEIYNTLHRVFDAVLWCLSGAVRATVECVSQRSSQPTSCTCHTQVCHLPVVCRFVSYP